jgi:hypothetical protein
MWRSLRTFALMSALLAAPSSGLHAQFEWSAEQYQRGGSFLSEETLETSAEPPANAGSIDMTEEASDEPLPTPQGVQPRTNDGLPIPPITEPAPPEASLGRTYSLPDQLTENRFTTMGYDVYRGAVAGIKPYVPSVHGIMPSWVRSAHWPWGHHHGDSPRPFQAFGGTSGLSDFTREHLSCPSGACEPGGCGPGGCPTTGPLATSPWFGGVQALMLQRGDADNRPLAETAGDTVLSTGDASTDLGAGVDVQLGRYLANGRAIEAIYWGSYPSNQTMTITPADVTGAINTDLAFNRLVYNNGLGTNLVSNWYGGAPGGARFQSIERGFTAHNLELNYLGNPHRRGQPLHYEWLVGARYLNLDDDLNYVSSPTSSVPGANPANELSYLIDVDNHLIGAQLGGRVDYCFTSHPRLSAHLGGNMGLYGNRVTQRQRIGGGNGLAISSVTGDPFDLESSETTAAFVGDFLAGLAYQCHTNWRITGGYRATTAAGIATSTGQIPDDFTRASVIDADDSLLLHGLYIGGEYNR